MPTQDRGKLPAIRGAYERDGVTRFYEHHGATYRNPHEEAVRDLLALSIERWQPDLRMVLDLACGSGEATLALRELKATSITGIDPYTGDAYRRRTGLEVELLHFEDIEAGALDERRYSLIVCSFALHLVERSRLPLLAYRLSCLAPILLVLTPNKRPHLQPGWGWTLEGEILHRRVRARCYNSTVTVEEPW